MKNIYKQFTYFLLLLFFSGCVFQKKHDAVADFHTNLIPEKLLDSQPVQQDFASITPTATSNQIPESFPELTEHVYSELSEIEIATESQATPIPVYLDIPDESHIRRCQKYFLEKYSRDYLAGLDRRKSYGLMIQKKISERGLPYALNWIPMVETWFKNDAYSPSHASGIWQLIPATAKTFGLRIDDWIDERRDPEKATDIALDVLEYLYEKTDDWLLAIAAYNAGEGCVNRAIRTVGTRDYWTLARYRALPSQTRFYVSAILALAEIGRDPQVFGLEIPTCIEQNTCCISIDKQVNLYQIANKTALDITELKDLNPSLKRAWTPPDYESFELRFPVSRLEDVKELLYDLPELDHEDWIVHVIKQGETLSGLAKQYRSTIDAIMTANQLEKHIIITGKKLLIPSGLTWE